MTTRMKDNMLKGIFILGMLIVLIVQSIFEGKQPAESEQIRTEHNLSDDSDEENKNTERNQEVRNFESISH